MASLLALLEPHEATGDVIIARVPPGITKKGQLFEALKTQLRFPAPWGSNWDAIDEALNDLSWLQASTIVIAHDNLPDFSDEDLSTWLNILATAIDEWREQGGKSFSVVWG